MEHLINSDLAPPGRLSAYLHEVVESSPLPVIDLSSSRFDDGDFHLRFSGRLLGDAYLTRFEASSVVLRRSDKEIGVRSSHLVLLAMLDRGAYEQSFDGLVPMCCVPGALLLTDLDWPQTVYFSRLTVTTCAYIPRRLFRPFLDEIGFSRPILISPDNELYGLLVACLRAAAAMPDPTPAASSAAVGTLTRLMSIAQGLHPQDHQDLGRSLQDARRQRAQLLISEHCHDPRLNPQMIADRLGLSLRSLNTAFATSGRGVAASIVAARLDWAKELLLRFPQRSVLQIALSCGFNNLSSFYRSFSQAYGAPPAEFRNIAQIGKRDFPDSHDEGDARL
jgi:AraC-like DNA-binding protein